MSGLILKLGPKERLLINGAVIENGDRRSRLSVLSAGANILRLRDAIHPDQTTSPVRRVCYAVQLMISQDRHGIQAENQIAYSIEELREVFIDTESQRLLSNAKLFLSCHNYYQCLKTIKILIPKEDKILAARL